MHQPQKEPLKKTLELQPKCNGALEHETCTFLLVTSSLVVS